MHRTGPRLFLTSALAAAALTGCGSSSGLVAGATHCLPEPLSVDPAKVAVGGSVTVSSPAFACDTRYPAGKLYTLTLVTGRAEPIDLGTVAVHRDGAFLATVIVPATASPGEADLGVGGSPYDEPCNDGESSCAAYSTVLTLLPPP